MKPYMKSLLVIVFTFVACANSIAQKAVIKGPDGADPVSMARVGELIVFDRSLSDGAGFWDIDECRDGKSQFLSQIEFGNVLVTSAMKPGNYTFELTVFKDNSGDRQKHTVQVIATDDSGGDEPNDPDEPDDGDDDEPIEPGDIDSAAITASLSPLVPNDRESAERLIVAFKKVQGTTTEQMYDSAAKSRMVILQTRSNKNADWEKFVSTMDRELIRNVPNIKTPESLQKFFDAVVSSLAVKTSSVIYSQPLPLPTVINQR